VVVWDVEFWTVGGASIMPLNAFSSAVIRRGGRIRSADSLTAKPG
jgi:hypothetical protein